MKNVFIRGQTILRYRLKNQADRLYLPQPCIFIIYLIFNLSTLFNKKCHYLLTNRGNPDKIGVVMIDCKLRKSRRFI